MRTVLHRTARDVRAVPWKNGRGATEELALWPPAASFAHGDFDWRISRAPVTEPGAFSRFPGHDRILVVIEGDELVLEHPGRAPPVWLRPLQPYAFPGDWDTHASLPRGAIRDFNVMFRAESTRAEVEVVSLTAAPRVVGLTAPHVFLHALTGLEARLAEDADGARQIQAGESLWIQEPDAGEELRVAAAAGTGTALVVRFTPAGAP